jgi:hypothetical protein
MDDCMIHAQFESNLMWPREVRFRSTTEVYQGAEKVSWGFSLLLGSSAHQDRIYVHPKTGLICAERHRRCSG